MFLKSFKEFFNVLLHKIHFLSVAFKSLSSKLSFQLMGFAGYFSANLYSDVNLSIVPETHSKSMISWFPALIPLQELIRLQPEAEVRFIL